MKKYVLITGAFSGIGKAFAYEYAKLGRDLVLVARSQNKLTALKDEFVNKYKVDVKIIDLDLSSENASIQLFNVIKNKGIDVDILINNAGFGLKGEFLSKDLKSYSEMINLNMVTLTLLQYAQEQQILIFLIKLENPMLQKVN